jgi:hypothetical protein
MKNLTSVRALCSTGDNEVVRWLLTFVGFNALLFIVVLARLWEIGGFADTGLSGTGWFALCLGVAATSGLGVGLMALVFYSHRKDYDKDAYRSGGPRADQRP